MNKIVRTSLYLSLIPLLAGCSSIKLINTNQEFVSLMQQSAEAKRLHDDGTFDQYAFDFAVEGIRASYSANGDEAVKAAIAADTNQSKASLFNVAVRSYLQSGSVGDSEIPAIANEGKEVCSRMTGLDDLPTTCGYFYMVVPQAINNEWRRKIDPIVGRIDDLAGDESLSIDEGKTLVNAAEQFFAQLDSLAAVAGDMDFENAGASLSVSFAGQQDIFFCNAQDALISLDVVDTSAEGWDSSEQIAEAREPENRHLEALEDRAGGFDGCD